MPTVGRRYRYHLLQTNRNRGNWTAAEDTQLVNLVEEVTNTKSKRHSKHIQWADIAAKMFWRDGKQCRDRWFNQLDPSINRGEFGDTFCYFGQ